LQIIIQYKITHNKCMGFNKFVKVWGNYSQYSFT